VQLFAWNKPFEWSILAYVLNIPTAHERWRDPMVLAYSLALPGSLEKAGEVVDLGADAKKLSYGKVLIRQFCQPRVPTKKKPWTRTEPHHASVRWEQFLAYNRRDVEAERAFWRRCHRWDMPPEEWELWCLDQRINERGIPINMRVVRNAIRVSRAVVDKRLAEMRKITELGNPNSVAQLLPWLQGEGYPFEDLKKGHVKRARDEAPPGDYRQVLALRSEVSRASVKKFTALQNATDDDGRLRHTLQFAGAGRTWRWAGRKFQAQNLARPAPWLERTQEEAVRDLEWLDPEEIEWLYPAPMDLLSTCVRPVVQAPPGYMLVDADLNAIENRVLGWVSDDRKIMRVFEENRDPYIDFATYMYRMPYNDLYAEYKTGIKGKRTIAKPAVLGCGYMLGPGAEKENAKTGEIEATGLLGYAWNMGVRLTLEQSEASVKIWRETFTGVVDFWRRIDKAARRCIRTGQPQECGRLRFDRSGPFMRMILPSGRALHYCRPRIENKKTPWGEVRPTITYEGLSDTNQWARLTTHPGKLTENAVQAIARDLLAHGMRLADAAGIDIRLHVHDEILALALEQHAAETLQVLQQCMTTRPSWALDLPLGSAGTISRVFMKD
jgi:DNA polymerase